MSRIFFFDFIYKEGHKNLDSKYLYHFQKESKVDVLEPMGWYKKNNKLSFYEICSKRKKGGGYREVFTSCRQSIFAAAKLIKKHNYDIIVCGESEVLFLPLYMHAVGKDNYKKTVFIHHQDIDYLYGSRAINRIRRMIFHKYKNIGLHWVLEPFIKQSLVKEFGVNQEIIICIPHPPCNIYPISVKEFDCIGLSHSNDDKFIDNLILLEEQTHVFREKNLRIVLRSSSTSYNDEYLTVINQWLSEDEYKNFVQKAKCNFVPLPTRFNNRVSGVIIDAFANDSPVITTKTPLTEYYLNTYPKICCIFSYESFPDDIERLAKSQMLMDDFTRFKNDHDEKLLDNSVKIIEDKLKLFKA